jgi:hypothetical protein
VTLEHEMMIGYCLQDKKTAKNEGSAASGSAGSSSCTGPKLSAAEQRMKELAAGGVTPREPLVETSVSISHTGHMCAMLMHAS